MIIVFAVEKSWFHDNYNGTTTQYGLWRVCLFGNNSCDSWFSTNGPYSVYIVDRLNQARSKQNFIGIIHTEFGCFSSILF